MKKLLNTLLAATFLSGFAYAAEPATKDAAKAQADQQPVEGTHPAGAGKKPKKATRKDGSTAAPTATQDQDVGKHAAKKKAKEVNRPEPTQDVEPAPPAR